MSVMVFHVFEVRRSFISVSVWAKGMKRRVKSFVLRKSEVFGGVAESAVDVIVDVVVNVFILIATAVISIVGSFFSSFSPLVFKRLEAISL